MIDEIRRIREAAGQQIERANSLDELAELERTVVGKASELGRLKKGLGQLDPDERRQAGAAMNEATEALRAAMRIPNLLQNLFGEGVLSASFIPVYAQLVDEGEHELAVHVVESEAWFVEDQQRRVFHHRSGDQHEALVSVGEPVERFVGSV